jgi:hypothetical protein
VTVNSNFHGVDVDTKHVQMYMQSIACTQSDAAAVTDFSLDYLPLHRINTKSTGAYEHDGESLNGFTAEVNILSYLSSIELLMSKPFDMTSVHIQVIRDKHRCDCKRTLHVGPGVQSHLS